MSTPSNDLHAQRLEDLEVKLAYTEDAVDKLDAVVARQQTHIDALIVQVLQLKKRTPESGDSSGEFRSLRDDLPPHY
jgi:SlyX protein